MAKNWYVVHVLSGHEYKVQSYVENNKKSKSSLAEKIAQVLIPTEEILGLKAGKKVKTTKKILPSYLLVEMEMDDETWSFISHVPGVTNFVGSSKKPLPLRPEEITRIMERIESKKDSRTKNIPFHIGDNVKVIGGTFSDFSGVVEQINPEKSKVRVIISIFGRPTPIELDFLQIQLSAQQG
jgi:transcription termination/antitermination protein NusG